MTERSSGWDVFVCSRNTAGRGSEIWLCAFCCIKHSSFANRLYISAQKYLEDFYKKFGFETVGEPFLEEEIPHVDMVLYKEKCVFPSKCCGEEQKS